MRQRLGLLIILVGCGDATEPAASETTAASEVETMASTSTSSTTSSSTTTMEPQTGSESSSSTTGEPMQACGLEDLKAGTPNPIVSGTEAMQLPPDIADILLVSCGCHLADDHTVADVPDYPATGGFDMTTWAGWHALHPTTSMPYYTFGLTYVEGEVMPLPSFCNIEGQAMDPEDRAVMIEWLGMDAPDGATWMP